MSAIDFADDCFLHVQVPLRFGFNGRRMFSANKVYGRDAVDCGTTANHLRSDAARP